MIEDSNALKTAEYLAELEATAERLNMTEFQEQYDCAFLIQKEGSEDESSSTQFGTIAGTHRAVMGIGDVGDTIVFPGCNGSFLCIPDDEIKMSQA